MSSQGRGTKRKPGVQNGESVKRSRVSRACDQCRIAREKCDGSQPVCYTCSTLNRGCSYTTNPKRRGIQPGYIRTLELTLAWVFNNVSNAESVLNKRLSEEGVKSILLGRNTKDSNKLHKSWRRSKFFRDIERLLGGSAILRNGEEKSPAS